MALKNLFKNYEFLDDIYREPLEEVLSKNTFPMLDGFCKTLLTNYNDASAEAVNVILKTFYSAIHVRNKIPFKNFRLAFQSTLWMRVFFLIG